MLIRAALGCVGAVLCLVSGVPFLNAQVPGVTDNEIVIGSCSVLDGPASQLGQQMVTGATAYLNLVNNQGGVYGRKITLRAFQDGYDPAMATSCFASLQNNHVFAGAFFVGTPTAARYVPMAEAGHFPLVGLFTGAELLYSPFRHYVMNVRASYYDETRSQVDKLWAVGIHKIAVIYPDDAFGAAVLEGVKIALKRHTATPAATATYPRNTTQVESAIKVVQAANPEAVVLVGPYAPVAAMLHKSRERSWNPVFLSVSFVDTDDLIREAGPAAEGVIVTQVMPSASAVDLPTVAIYRKQLGANSTGAKLGYVSLEGFVDAMVLVEGLKRAGKDLTREKLIQALESMHNVDIGLGPDLKIEFSSTNHKGLHQVYLTVVRNGAAVPVENLIQALARK